MIWAILALSIVGLGFAGTAVALGIRVGSLKVERNTFELERDAALAALAVSQGRNKDLARVVLGSGKRLQSLREELATCGDPEDRSRAAIAGIELLLSSVQETAEEADTDQN